MRMRLCGVPPTCHAYNTALATCLDGAVKITYVGAKIATDILGDAKTEIAFASRARMTSAQRSRTHTPR